MSKIPRKNPSKSNKKSKGIAKKGPYNLSNNSNETGKKSHISRRFSIISNSYSDSDSEDESDSDSGSDSYDDNMYNVQQQQQQQQPQQQHQLSKRNDLSSASEDDYYSSSSDDDNVDFVQLTKQRRMRAMKAVKGLKKQHDNSDEEDDNTNNTSSQKLMEDEESELDDDLVDAVIEEEERKLDDMNEDSLNNRNDEDLNNLEDLDFNFNFDYDESNDDDTKNAFSNDSKNVVDKLKDEDIGEVISNPQPTINKSKSEENTSKKVDIDVPKFNDKEINSDADYEFDNDDLIQTLMKDNDDLELHNLDNSDDDFDYLIANQHNIKQTDLLKPTLKAEDEDTGNHADEDDDGDEADSGYLMKEETQAMLDDFNNTSTKSQSSFKNRRSSMYYNNTGEQEDLDDLDLDLLNNFEQFLPKQQAIRRRSSILNQTLLSSDSELDNDEIDKRIMKKKMKKLNRKLTSSNPRSNSSATQNVHAKDIRRMLGISNADTNLTSNFASNAIVDSDDDSKLLEYIFEDSESDMTPGTQNDLADIVDFNDGNETDEDLNLPKQTSKKIIGGIKNAKEILSSSKDKFCAPKLGTFITKKPFSVIDGFSTRFLHPLEENHSNSYMQKAASFKINEELIGSNSNVNLDELLNISEFDEDEYSNENEKLDEYFGEKRIPLTAFRNKNQPSTVNLVVDNSKTATTTNQSSNQRRFSYSDRLKKKHYKLSKSKAKPKVVNTRRPSIKMRRPSSSQSKSVGNVLNDLNGVDEVLLIGVEPYLNNPISADSTAETNSELNRDTALFNGFEIAGPPISHSNMLSRDRKSVGKLRKSFSKSKVRRASMAEAQAEGLRQTKSGLFDQNIMEDVEALLIDMGDAQEYGFLFGND